jgi:hypothetical protein
VIEIKIGKRVKKEKTATPRTNSYYNAWKRECGEGIHRSFQDGKFKIREGLTHKKGSSGGV